MLRERFIYTNDNVSYFLSDDGCIVRKSYDSKSKFKKWWIGNPPDKNELFHKVCQIAVDLGFLSKFVTYHLNSWEHNNE